MLFASTVKFYPDFIYIHFLRRTIRRSRSPKKSLDLILIYLYSYILGPFHFILTGSDVITVSFRTFNLNLESWILNLESIFITLTAIAAHPLSVNTVESFLEVNEKNHCCQDLFSGAFIAIYAGQQCGLPLKVAVYLSVSLITFAILNG